MSESSSDKLNSLKASLRRLAGVKAPAGQLSVPASAQSLNPYCQKGRDSCGNYPFCRSKCVNGSLEPVPNNNTADPNDCQTNSTGMWMGGPGNWYPCIEAGIGQPGCPIACNNTNEHGECACGKTIPDYYKYCNCDSCCGCPEDENDPHAFDCDKEPALNCVEWKDTRNDEPEAGHQWVTDCDGLLAQVENAYPGWEFPDLELPILPQHSSQGHRPNGVTRAALRDLIALCKDHPNNNGRCPFDPNGTTAQLDMYKKIAACYEYRKSNFAVSNSCSHPYGSAAMWRGYGTRQIVNPCRRKWKEACTNIVGACCVELSNGQFRCMSGKTWKDCHNLEGDWHGEGSKCTEGLCEKDPYYDYYEDEYYDYYDDRSGNSNQRVSENPPLKKPTSVTGPFQGLIHDKCDPSTWRMMGQPDIDENGNPIPVPFDPRPRLCKRGCFDHPSLEGYDCSKHEKNKKDQGSNAVADLMKSLRNKK